MNSKKISFGFNKSSKKTLLIQHKQEESKVELIECLEGHSIKIKDAVEEVKIEPLSIPIKETTKSLSDRIKEAQNNAKKTDVITDDTVPDSELTLDELAARELLREAKNQTEKSSSKVLEVKPAKDVLLIEGKEESTLEDYENVPIGDYGFAMLRGMGWKEGMGIGKNQKNIQTSVPELRPKGMGLGADKLASVEKPKIVTDKDGKELILKKNAYAKIIAGHYKGYYCQVQGLDDEAGRVIVKTALKNNVLSLNEFLLVPVTEDEYNKSSKVINNAKYEEFKERKLDDRNVIKEEASANSSSKSRSSHRKQSSSSEDQDTHRRRHKKSSKRRSRHRSRSNSSDSEHNSKRKSNKNKSKYTHSSSDSDDYKRRHRKKDSKNRMRK